jgi:ArsR family transcriptional regulator
VRNIEWRRGSLDALPLGDESVDAALLLLALTYLTEPRSAVGEAVRILRPGGRLVVVDLLRHDREELRRQLGHVSLGFEPEDLTAQLHEAGLERAACQALSPEPGAKGPALLLAAGARPNRGESRTQNRQAKEMAR